MVQRIYSLEIISGSIGVALGVDGRDEGIFIPYSILPEVVAAITRELITPYMEAQEGRLIDLAESESTESAESAGVRYWSCVHGGKEGP